jgi:hypothetical protein
MKPEQVYQELIDLAEKLEITVSEQNLRKTGVKAKSGLCKVKGKYLFIMDKHIHKKINLLASHLASMPHEDVYIVPAVRELLDQFGNRNAEFGKKESRD